MKTRLWFGLMCLGLWSVGAAGGATWEQWVAVPPSPVTVQFHDLYGKTPPKNNNFVSSDEVLRPDGYYLGELEFSLAEGTVVEGPLTATVGFVYVDGKHMDWDGELYVPPDFVAKPLPRVPVPAPFSRVVFEDLNDWPLHVPVYRPRDAFHWTENLKTPSGAIIPVYTLQDARGQVLARGFLDAYSLRGFDYSSRWAGRDETDKTLQSLADSSSSWLRMDQLPEHPQAFIHVPLIWFTPELWAASRDRITLLRRLLLMGVDLTGSEDIVMQMHEALETNWRNRLLLGRLSTSPQSDRRVLPSFSSLSTMSRDGELVDPFGNQAPPYAMDMHAYWRWSFWGLMAYMVGVVVLLIRVFGFKKGEQRVSIWLSLPAWTVLCAAILYFGGVMVLNRRIKTDVTEYRLSVAGWPDVYCRAVASVVNYTKYRPVWRYPTGLWGGLDDAYRNDSLDGFWKTNEEFRHPEENQKIFSMRQGGALDKREFFWFEEGAPPLEEIESAEIGARRFRVREDNDGVWMRVDGIWHGLGASEAGQILTAGEGISHGKKEKLYGLPSAINDALKVEGEWTPCTNPDHQHEKPSLKAPKARFVTVVLQKNAPMKVRLDAGGQAMEEKGRVIWVTQW